MSTIPTKPAVARPQPSAKPKKSRYKLIADNRKARYNYEIGDAIEAGIVLTGTEVKSLRLGKAQIAESYASNEKGELFPEAFFGVVR